MTILRVRHHGLNNKFFALLLGIVVVLVVDCTFVAGSGSSSGSSSSSSGGNGSGRGSSTSSSLASDLTGPTETSSSSQREHEFKNLSLVVWMEGILFPAIAETGSLESGGGGAAKRIADAVALDAENLILSSIPGTKDIRCQGRDLSFGGFLYSSTNEESGWLVVDPHSGARLYGGTTGTTLPLSSQLLVVRLQVDYTVSISAGASGGVVDVDPSLLGHSVLQPLAEANSGEWLFNNTKAAHAGFDIKLSRVLASEIAPLFRGLDYEVGLTAVQSSSMMSSVMSGGPSSSSPSSSSGQRAPGESLGPEGSSLSTTLGGSAAVQRGGEDEEENPSPSCGTGCVIGIIAGTTLLLALIIVLVFLLLSTRQNRKGAEERRRQEKQRQLQRKHLHQLGGGVPRSEPIYTVNEEGEIEEEVIITSSSSDQQRSAALDKVRKQREKKKKNRKKKQQPPTAAAADGIFTPLTTLNSGDATAPSTLTKSEPPSSGRFRQLSSGDTRSTATTADPTVGRSHQPQARRYASPHRSGTANKGSKRFAAYYSSNNDHNSGNEPVPSSATARQQVSNLPVTHHQPAGGLGVPHQTMVSASTTAVHHQASPVVPPQNRPSASAAHHPHQQLRNSSRGAGHSKMTSNLF